MNVCLIWFTNPPCLKKTNKSINICFLPNGINLVVPLNNVTSSNGFNGSHMCIRYWFSFRFSIQGLYIGDRYPRWHWSDAKWRIGYWRKTKNSIRSWNWIWKIFFWNWKRFQIKRPSCIFIQIDLIIFMFYTLWYYKQKLNSICNICDFRVGKKKSSWVLVLCKSCFQPCGFFFFLY